MRSEIFKLMSVNRQDFIKEINSGKNPNPLRNRVEEELKKTETMVEIAEKSLLQVERVFDYTAEDVVMESLWTRRRDAIRNSFEAIKRETTGFINRLMEALPKKLNEWFEVVLAHEI